jgi:hypothetical protein
LQEETGKEAGPDAFKRVLKKRLRLETLPTLSEGERNEEDFQRDKEYQKTLKRQEDAGELRLYYFDESGFSTTPCVPYGCNRSARPGKHPAIAASA